jgi:transcriptional regulator of acetoin/glycerol metabolism
MSQPLELSVNFCNRSVVKETWEQRELRHEEETKSQLLEALRGCDWNQDAAARELGMIRQAFWNQLKRNLPLRLITCGGCFRA